MKADMIQKVSDPGYRVDTGQVQFGEDWPGIFMRGDHAMGRSNMLRVIARLPNEKLSDRAYAARITFLLEMADLFASSDISTEVMR